MSFEVILPFLKPIRHLLEAETVSEIMVNPDSSVWIEEDGQIQPLPGIRFDDGALLTGLEVIANRFGKKLDADSPIMNLRLPDGSRMAALIPPVVNPRPMMTIRKFTSREFTVDDLIERKMLTEEQAEILAVCRSAWRQRADLRRHRFRQDHPAKRVGRIHSHPGTNPGPRRYGRAIYKEAARHLRRSPTRYPQEPDQLRRLA